MKPLTITIEPPVTEHCKKCDYEASRSFSSIMMNCPSCGEERSIQRGARTPKECAVYVLKSQGNYNLLNPTEKQWSYRFYNVPGDKQSYGFVVDEDLETDPPIDCAYELNEIIEGYLFHSDKENIAKLCEILSDPDEEGRQDQLRIDEKREKLERELFELNHDTGCYAEATPNKGGK